MFFGYGVCDVIAALSLCERVAIELRNYKDAHMQLQQLLAELDLLRERNAHIWEPWYSLGVLYDRCNGQHAGAADAFYKCLEGKPELSNVRARLEAQ
ncbi:hypothetical protein FOPG_13243 [Fusarium oxysporum f. sp. conglutinans race 2 54008]|uniref:Tetratricopeptide repeat protein n=1 Tax=Fusarium oxysporum f. sp. conglutinans race 2 54008 TaxID=1089457 RepID=X0H4L7_FUSOX|nr:hypothetical protein FOPG_13243 [Fusarium oxysporum f. sp. conglutinans race 2 54008]